LEVLDFDFIAAKHYRGVRASLEIKGLTIGSYELLIAARALNPNLGLVTKYERGFQRFSDSIIEN
jgi:tRNA(fMet)-specific endonuclease VapC